MYYTELLAQIIVWGLGIAAVLAVLAFIADSIGRRQSRRAQARANAKADEARRREAEWRAAGHGDRCDIRGDAGEIFAVVDSGEPIVGECLKCWGTTRSGNDKSETAVRIEVADADRPSLQPVRRDSRCLEQ